MEFITANKFITKQKINSSVLIKHSHSTLLIDFNRMLKSLGIFSQHETSLSHFLWVSQLFSKRMTLAQNVITVIIFLHFFCVAVS